MSRFITRRDFIRAGVGAAAMSALPAELLAGKGPRMPNVLLVFADQMRYTELGCSGNRQVRTPNMDRLASEGVLFTNGISGNPVCSPYRGMLFTGRYGHTTGVVSNGLRLPASEITIAEELKRHGCATGYIGKWHLDGQTGLEVPRGRRQGFDYWVSENIRHVYSDCPAWTSEGEKQITLRGYQPNAQTDLAVDYIRRHKDAPFFLCMSWGPPHVPLFAPSKYTDMYDPAKIEQSPNVVGDYRKAIATCYAMVTNLDDNIGRLMRTLREEGIEDDTIFVFTSDHGDMLMSHGQLQKQRPWEEAIHIPFILRYPRRVKAGRKSDVLLNSVDVMPTLLGLTGKPVPKGVQGTDLSSFAVGSGGREPKSAFLQDILPCGQAVQTGIKEWRGVRTKRYTYARLRDRGWVLYDNKADPHQLDNLIDKPEGRKLREEMEAELQSWLKRTGDDFASAEEWKSRLGRAST